MCCIMHLTKALQIFKVFLKDKNYILASLPGTHNATVGGIISNNSHGKDVKYGNFSNRIISLKILLTDGNVMKVKNNDTEVKSPNTVQ